MDGIDAIDALHFIFVRGRTRVQWHGLDFCAPRVPFACAGRALVLRWRQMPPHAAQQQPAEKGVPMEELEAIGVCFAVLGPMAVLVMLVMGKAP